MDIPGRFGREMQAVALSRWLEVADGGWCGERLRSSCAAFDRARPIEEDGEAWECWGVELCCLASPSPFRLVQNSLGPLESL